MHAGYMYIDPQAVAPIGCDTLTCDVHSPARGVNSKQFQAMPKIKGKDCPGAAGDYCGQLSPSWQVPASEVRNKK